MNGDQPAPDSGHAGGLGALLRQAREARGLSLSEVAERTHVRATYLDALEAGAYERLPEEIYTRNFLRLYARTVGVDPDDALERYARERATTATGSSRTGETQAGGGEPAPRRIPNEAPQASSARPSSTGRAGPPRRLPPSLAPLLATLVLAGALVGVAVWGFNRLLFQPERNVANQSPPPAVEGLPADPLGGNEAGGASDGLPDEVELTIRTEPPGAEVSVDAFPLPGTTPIEGVPVTAREERTIRITRDGYRAYEASVDLSADRELEVALEPLPPAGDPVEEEAAEGAAEDERLVIEVNEASWVEVYRGTERGEGERLVYTTAQPGTRYAFESLPLYVHLGNAGGVDIMLDGEPQPPLGGGGSVTGRAFEAP